MLVVKRRAVPSGGRSDWTWVPAMRRCEDETGMRGWEMEDRGWRIEDGGSRMEDRRWRIEDGGGRGRLLWWRGAYVVSRES
jgi:hypothetical protein